MDETALICVGEIPYIDTRVSITNHQSPAYDRMVVIDFLAPAMKETKRKTSSGPLSNGDSTSGRFTLAKQIYETLSLKR